MKFWVQLLCNNSLKKKNTNLIILPSKLLISQTNFCINLFWLCCYLNKLRYSLYFLVSVMLFFLQFSFSKELKNHALFWLVVSVSEAYDALDPNGNITIKWDIISWTPDGYVVSISLLIESLSFEHILCHFSACST